MLRPLGIGGLAMANETDVRSVRALDPTPFALSPMFDPFIKLLTDLGAPTLDSFPVRELTDDADRRLRLLSLHFATNGHALRFMGRFLSAAHDQPEVQQLLDRVGPAQIITIDGQVQLFWFGVVGVDVLLN
jgi:hypothetical protein